MPLTIPLEEKYEHQGWPSLDRPDLQPPAGWSLDLLLSVNRIHHHALSADGEQIAFIWERDGLSDLYLMTTDGGWPRRLTAGRGPTIYWWDSSPRWSPDGQLLAFTMDGHVYVVPADGSHLPQKISDFTAGAASPVWMPDGNGLLVSVSRHDTSRLLLTDRDGAWPRPLTSGEDGDDMDARAAPDGQQVVYVHRPQGDLNRLELRLVDVAGGQAHTLSGEPRQKDWSPRWSPDGTQIAFLSQRSGFNEVWLVRPNGEGLRQLTKLGKDIGEIGWSPDGNHLALTINRGGAFDLALLDVAGGALMDLRRGKGVHHNLHWLSGGEGLTVEYEDALCPPDLYRVAVPGGQSTQLTFSNPPALRQRSLVVPERVSYRSYDGLEIPAFLYRPPHPNGVAVLYAHGGPTAQYTYEWDIFAQYLVAKGYTFLAPNFRGSTGYGVAFEHANYDDWGHGDMHDCLQGARFLAGLDGVDPARIGIYGPSYGGFMVACCLSRDPDYLFACGVSKYGDAHLFTSWAQCERETRLYTEMQVGHPVSNRAVYEQGSPVRDAANVQRPVLLLHGLEDDVVPPEGSEEWVQALRRHGKTFEYKTYAGEHHSFLRRENALDAYRRIERFLDWYLWPAATGARPGVPPDQE